MDLNHIELPSSLVAELYRSVLIDTGNVPVKPSVRVEESPSSAGKSGNDIKFLGENRKRILIMVEYSDAVHIPDADLSLLIAMLTACKLTIADVAIVNKNNIEDNTGKAIVEKLASRVVLLFGIDPVSFGLPMNFPEFQLQAFSGATYLYAPELVQYNDNPSLKRKLWDCLKRLFVV